MLDDLLARNSRYAEGFSDGGLGPAPAQHLAIVTCMDVRIDVYAMLGLQLGDAHIIRNAGGRVSDDVLRSLIVSVEILGTTSVLVIQHTDCGMAKVTDRQLAELVHERRGADASAIDFLTIDDHADALRNDVAYLGSCGLLPTDLEAHGLLYDVATGRLSKV